MAENESHGDASENVVNGSSEQHKWIGANMIEDHGGNGATDINQEHFGNLEKELLDIYSATANYQCFRQTLNATIKISEYKSPHHIQNIMGSYKLLKSRRDIDLKIIVRFLRRLAN